MFVGRGKRGGNFAVSALALNALHFHWDVLYLV